MYSSCTVWVLAFLQTRLQNLEMRRQTLFSMVHTYSLLMNLKNFVCNIGEDSELLMSLYDPDQSEFIRLGCTHPFLSLKSDRGPPVQSGVWSWSLFRIPLAQR